jgi:hypothetical protein
MESAQQTIFRSVQREAGSRNITIVFGYAAFVIVVLIAIYFDSMSSGTTPADLASMTVFP